MWKSSEETRTALEHVEHRDRLRTCYSLSNFWRTGIPASDYQVAAGWENLVSLSPAGEAALTVISGVEEEFGRSTAIFILFSEFFHTELLVDWRTSDLDGISSLLSREIRDKRVRFPHRFGRALYDRFNDEYLGNRTDHLLADATERLIGDSPQGVYQIDEVVVGPLGVLRSEASRFKPCSASLQLWHCSDTGCGMIHSVRLDPPEVPLTTARRKADRQLRDNMGRPSEWSTSLRTLHGDESVTYRKEYADLPELIADCIVGPDRSVLVVKALNSPNRLTLRELLGAARGKKLSEGPPESVVSRLGAEEQLQLLLALDDSALIQLIDSVIAEKAIRVPLSECRSPKQSYRRWGGDAGCELSALGVRSKRQHEVPHLFTCIWNAYERNGLHSELEWRVRGTGRSLRESLMEYIRKEGPVLAVKQLILTSSTVTATICSAVNASVSHVSAGDGISINRMLWKLGFNPDQYDEFLPRLSGYIREFRDVVLSLPSIELERYREKARSAGVNLFVALEEFLDKLLSYNVWLLAADHFGSQFSFEVEAARRTVSLKLGQNCLSPEGLVTWSSTGHNTLGTLLRYLSEAEKWIRSRIDADRDAVIRPEADLPFYFKDPDQQFPFRHKEFWADCDINELRAYSDGFSTIEKLLLQADLAGIRNGLDHYRDESTFPTSEAMLACVTRLQEAVDRADAGRFLPKPFWLQGRISNRFGQVEYTYRDYAGRVITLYGPPTISGLPRHHYGNPALVAPLASIGYPNSQLLFRLREASQYSTYWAGYPRRRKIPPEQVNDMAAAPEAASAVTGT
jgi:hypothetical protein